MPTFYSILLNSTTKHALRKWVLIYDENENQALNELMQLFVDFLGDKIYFKIPENCINSDKELKYYLQTLRENVRAQTISEQNLQKLKKILNALCVKAHNIGFLYKYENNIFLKLLKFLREFSLIPQSEKIVSYATTYFLMALASNSNKKLTLDLEMQMVESPTSPLDPNIGRNHHNRKRNFDQLKAVLLEKKLDHLNTILTRLFSLLNSSIPYLYNDKKLTNVIFSMLNLNFQFLNINTCQQFYVTILTTADKYNILLIVLNHIHAMLKNKCMLMMCTVCSMDAVKVAFFNLLMDKRISIQKLILLILIEIHDQLDISDKYITDKKHNDLIFMKLYNDIMRKLSLQLIFKICMNRYNFLEYIINHWVQYQNNLDKINLIIETGWEYNEFQNFHELHKLLKKYIGTSVKYSIVILKIINHASTVMFHNCTSHGNEKIDINLCIIFLKLLPNIWKTVGDNNNEVLIAELLHMFNFDINSFYNLCNLSEDYQQLMLILTEIFFKQLNYVIVQHLYRIFILSKLENKFINCINRTIINSYLQSEPIADEIKNINRLSEYIHFCVMVEHDNYSIDLHETKKFLNVLKPYIYAEHIEKNEEFGILIITYSNLVLFCLTENLRENGDISLEIQEDFNTIYEYLKDLLKFHHWKSFFAYAVFTSFCRIVASVRRQLKDTAFIHLSKKLQTDTFEDVINFLHIRLSNVAADNNSSNIYFLRIMIVSFSRLYSFNVTKSSKLVWKILIYYVNETIFDNQLEILLKSICGYSYINYQNPSSIFCESMGYILVNLSSIKGLHLFLQKITIFINNNFKNDHHIIIGNIYTCILKNEFLSTTTNNIVEQQNTKSNKIINIFVKLRNVGEKYLNNFGVYVYKLLQKHKPKFLNDGLKVIEGFCDMIKDNAVVTTDINDDFGNDVAITERTAYIGNNGAIADIVKAEPTDIIATIEISDDENEPEMPEKYGHN